MQVNEIFKSIQGEGPNFGKPAIFLRTAQCNLKCTWCDTKYTWDWENYDFTTEVKEMTIDEIKKSITDLKIKHLVITGGEPLLQQDDLADLLSFLKPDFYVELETNFPDLQKSYSIHYFHKVLMDFQSFQFWETHSIDQLNLSTFCLARLYN